MKSMSPKPECPPPALPGTDLRVRPMTMQDLEPLHVLLSSPDVMRYLEPPYTLAQTTAFLRRAISQHPPVLAAEADVTFIGYIIFHAWDETSMEIGWVLLPAYQGRGFATALTILLIRMAREKGKQPVIECSPAQKATAHIARKFGFVRTETRDGLDVYRLRV